MLFSREGAPPSVREGGLLGFSMPKGLKRYYGRGHLHFITFSCYGRRPLLRAVRAKNLFLKELARVRREYAFALVGLDM